MRQLAIQEDFLSILNSNLLMELISYRQFSGLRLSNFLSPDVALAVSDNWEWMGGRWVNEGIGFTSFSRLKSVPNETGGLELDLKDLALEVRERLLSTLELPLKKGLTLSDVCSILGAPTATKQFVPHRRTLSFIVGTAWPYAISCTIEDEDGLTFVSIIRQDVLEKIKSEAADAG